MREVAVDPRPPQTPVVPRGSSIDQRPSVRRYMESWVRNIGGDLRYPVGLGTHVCKFDWPPKIEMSSQIQLHSINCCALQTDPTTYALAKPASLVGSRRSTTALKTAGFFQYLGGSCTGLIQFLGSFCWWCTPMSLNAENVRCQTS